MGGLACFAAGCITFLVFTSVWQAGDGCNQCCVTFLVFTSVWQASDGCESRIVRVYMQPHMDFQAGYADNKRYITDVGSPGWNADVCDGDYVRVSQISGPFTPRWYAGPSSPAQGSGKQPYTLLYLFRVDDDAVVGSTSLSVEVNRCNGARFTTGEFTNGARRCYSKCDEDNVEGAYCDYSCYAGYKRIGPSRVTCLGTTWSVTNPPYCEVVNCGAPPVVPNADLDCPKGHNYNKKCYVHCHIGYQLTGSSFTVCQQSETWTDIRSPCRDSIRPTFPQGCVPDIEVAAAPVGQDTVVSWTKPAVQDNAGNTNVFYRLPGSTATTSNTSAVFQVGVHTVVVFAEDEAHNTEVCLFTVTVKAVTCPLPNEQLNVTYMLYRPDPYGLSPHGTNLNLTCDRGYPQHGAKVITCQRIGTTYTARWTWQGDTIDMKPNCIVQPCPALIPPKNGALVCFTTYAGTDCLMFCNENYDIPKDAMQVSAGRWTCYISGNETRWHPTTLPTCSRVEDGHVAVQAEIFYFSGSCNDSREDLKLAFVERMRNSPLLQARCQTACIPANVQVFCGEVDQNFTRGRRSANQFYVKVTFQIVIQVSNTTTQQKMTQIQSDINAFLKKEVTGNGSLVFDGLTTDNSSVRNVSVVCDCPSGKACNNKFICVGCSKGYYMPADKKCYECPVNTYQEDDGAAACVPCPAGSFTESTGSYNISQCKGLRAGDWGEWSMWTLCSLTCGGGQQHRQRRCDSPAPEVGGRDCQGSAKETINCGLEFCPVDGAWSEWSDWAVCSATCGGGETTRARQCNKPAAQNGGLNCSGSDFEVKICNNETSCPVHGGWGEWSGWTPCSASCDGGTQSRDRLCNNPVPSQGGSNCTGKLLEIVNCNTHQCPMCPSFAQPQNTKVPVVMVSGDERNASVECLPDYVWAMYYEPLFYCGPFTNYTWSTEPNFTAAYEPPFCSEMIAITGGSGQFNIPMKHECINEVDVLSDIKQQVDSNLNNLPCKNVQNVSKECATAVLVTCDKPKPTTEQKFDAADNATQLANETQITSTTQLPNSTTQLDGANNATQPLEKPNAVNSTEQLTIIVDLNGEIGDNTHLKQGTPEFDEYMMIIAAIDESVNQIYDQADLYFTLRVNGQDVQPEADKISAEGNYHCPSGTGVHSGFCVKCPAGTFEAKNFCLFCPMGQYQDEIGRTECKDCPAGYAWTTVGAYSVDQCSEPFEKPMEPTDPEDENNESNTGAQVNIALAVGVAVAAFVVVVVAVVAVVCVVKRRRLKKLKYAASNLSTAASEGTEDKQVCKQESSI